MAPEVMQGKYDQTCDIWSSGVILYILVTSVPPFNGETDEDILAKVKTMKYTFDSNASCYGSSRNEKRQHSAQGSHR